MRDEETAKNNENELDGRPLPLKHDSTVKLENGDESYTYRLAMILPDNNLVCKSISKAMSEALSVGAMVNLVSPIDNGSCVTPVQITAISYQAELVALKVMGKPQLVQRRMFARVKSGVGVQLKLQLDNHTSRYKSLEVSDISIGGVGAVIFSKNPIAAGHYAKLEIQLPTTNSNNRIVARGQIVHCSPKSQNRMAYLLGIKFVELSDNDQRKIIEYIAGLQEKADRLSCACYEYKKDNKNGDESDQNKKDPKEVA